MSIIKNVVDLLAEIKFEYWSPKDSKYKNVELPRAIKDMSNEERANLYLDSDRIISWDVNEAECSAMVEHMNDLSTRIGYVGEAKSFPYTKDNGSGSFYVRVKRIADTTSKVSIHTEETPENDEFWTEFSKQLARR